MQSKKTEILRMIRNNAKLTVKDIAVMLGNDEEEVSKLIKEMEEEQIICGYNTVINWDKTDDERVTALIEVKVQPQRGEGFDRIAERIYNYEEVTSLYLMSGGFDMTVFIEGKTMKEVAQFVARKLSPMDGVLSTSTHFVLKKYKEAGTKVEQRKKDERQVVMA
ncbi:MAG: Lrp/AsnC family transcriptional regulator [Lachnospiraceae bacterium]|jgi:DNA-binding Lrp family transcriptional regulator|nr:Lrp/AsnC family transcriptional regulator [Lachnospiraceae bacterium]